MGRTVLVVLVLLILVVAMTVVLYLRVDCPECPAHTSCLRCKDRRRISFLESRRRIPLDPDLKLLLQSRDQVAEYAGDLARKHGKTESETLVISIQTTLRYAVTTLVEGPEGPLVLAVLTPEIWSISDGTPARAILYDRKGRERDRLDFSMPGAYPSGFRMVVDPRGGSFAVIPDLDAGLAKATDIRIARGAETRVLARASWPRDWPVKGVARIIARDGSLEIVLP